jgi:ABC-type lipoprotein release transport system permease subunit
MTKVKDGWSAESVISSVDAMFEAGPQKTSTQTEAAFQAQFASMLGNLPTFLGWIGSAILVAIFFSVLNTNGMAARERSRDVGVLKALGFRDRLASGMLLLESMLLIGGGGLIGVGLAWLSVPVFRRLFGILFPNYHIDAATVGLGLATAVAIGFLGGLIPALRLGRLRTWTCCGRGLTVKLVPLRYPLRSLFVRLGPTLFSAFGIGLTVAVLGGVLALREGFSATLAENGRDDVAVYLRPGATSEGESVVRYPDDAAIIKTRPEIALDAAGRPLAAIESYLGVKLEKLDGTGTTIVTVRGVEEASFAIHGDRLRVVAGRTLVLGADELIVGAPLSRRMKGCQVGGTVTLNVTPFKVVGIVEHEGG